MLLISVLFGLQKQAAMIVLMNMIGQTYRIGHEIQMIGAEISVGNGAAAKFSLCLYLCSHHGISMYFGVCISPVVS